VSARPAQRSGSDAVVTALLLVALAYGVAHAGEPASPQQARPRPSATTAPNWSARPSAGLSFTDQAGCRPTADYASPRLDRRVRQLLVAAAAQHRIRVSCLHTGHSWFVAGTTRVSNHSLWRAVDVDQVDGRPVSPANQAAHQLVLWIGQGGAGVHPSEVGSPWDPGSGPWFTNEAHQDHIHVGFAGPTRAGGGR
jgi:hypothetical protein